MALDFSVLQGIDPAGAFFRGQEAVRAEADRNLLRQAQMEQMAAQRENMLAQRQQRLEEAEMRRRAGEAQNALATYAASGQPMTPSALARFGEPGIKLAEALRKQQADQVEQEIKVLDYATRRLAAANPQTYPAIRADLARINPQFAAGLPEQFDAEQVMSLARQGLSLKEQIESATKETVLAPGASLYRGGKLVATAPVKEPESKLLSPEEEAQRIRIALASRPPAQPREPAAPTITQIQDPSDPMRMITIDARRYTGGSVGAPGVIGASGKTVKAEADALKKEQAQSDASAILDTLKVAYSNLDRLRAIPSEQRGVLSNLTSGVAATGVGQVAGRMVGTEAQTQRDIIASARNQLFAAVKNATGLSAQNLNSNVEFTTWLNSLTDPSRSIESNRVILDNMERFIASGGKHSARTAEGKVKPSGAPAAPNIDALLNKYK